MLMSIALLSLPLSLGMFFLGSYYREKNIGGLFYFISILISITCLLMFVRICLPGHGWCSCHP